MPRQKCWSCQVRKRCVRVGEWGGAEGYGMCSGEAGKLGGVWRVWADGCGGSRVAGVESFGGGLADSVDGCVNSQRGRACACACDYMQAHRSACDYMRTHRSACDYMRAHRTAQLRKTARERAEPAPAELREAGDEVWQREGALDVGAVHAQRAPPSCRRRRLLASALSRPSLHLQHVLSVGEQLRRNDHEVEVRLPGHAIRDDRCARRVGGATRVTLHKRGGVHHRRSPDDARMTCRGALGGSWGGVEGWACSGVWLRDGHAVGCG
eukprot:366296-Chlamydomonas_euryale.AAC.19